MLKFQQQRPTVSPAACVQVSESPSFASAPVAHVTVGYGAVMAAALTGTTLGQPGWLLARHEAAIQGITVNVVKQSVMKMDPVGGVRGKPPRGRPV